MGREQRRIVVEYGRGATFVTFVDERILDDEQIRQLQESFEPVIERNDDGEMVLNFVNVEFMSSAVLGLLVRVYKRISERGGRLKLVNLDPGLRKVFQITQLDKIIEVS
ncbi:MAG: STAS domain-containing protein [Phycisphaerales bacterium]|nr:MAG: STAS domain-containing protein [Phycisphaerales bacterium]